MKWHRGKNVRKVFLFWPRLMEDYDYWVVLEWVWRKRVSDGFRHGYRYFINLP